MGEVAADEHDAGRQQSADYAGGPGSGTRWRRGHPTATRGERLCCHRGEMPAKLGGVSPEAVVRWQKRAGRAFIRYVVEVVSGFDHGQRG